MTTRPPRTMSRRTLVQTAGVAAGLAVAGSFGARPARAAGAIKLHVGVLLPTGASYPRLDKSLLEGLHLGFDEAGGGKRPVAATLATRTVERGYGGALTAARELLDEGADVVVAGVSSLVAERLAPLFAERKASLVVANAGAHVVAPRARSAHVLHNSLLHWQASFALGRWAATSLGSRGFLATALHDAGYDSLYAFRRGFESRGGVVVGDAVTHVVPADAGLGAVFAATRETRANVLFGLYSGRSAQEFVRGLASSGVGAKPAVGTLTAEDFALGGLGPGAAGAVSCASWTATRGTRANQAFMQAFRARTGRSADPYAVLGYDTALLVAEGARRAAARRLGSGRLVRALRGAAINGPRGRLVVDAATNTVVGPLSVRQVKRTAQGLVNVEIARAPSVAVFPGGLSGLARTHAGYLNEYLCT